jgi:hypothetical protein
MIFREGEIMLDNNLYNLMSQIVEESRSVWRIKTTYEQDAANCDECLSFWKKLLEQKQARIEQMTRYINTHITERQLDKLPDL